MRKRDNKVCTFPSGSLGTSKRCKEGSHNSGFTLMEVLVALVILSTSLYILLGHHYSIMGLQQTISDELIYNQLMETAVAKAELGTMTEKLADAGDFGERYDGYTWNYSAVQSGSDPAILIYAITLTITGPSDSRSYDFFYYNIGNPVSTKDGGKGATKNNSKGKSEAGKRGGNNSSQRSSSSSSRSSSSSNSDFGGFE